MTSDYTQYRVRCHRCHRMLTTAGPDAFCFSCRRYTPVPDWEPNGGGEECRSSR